MGSAAAAASSSLSSATASSSSSSSSSDFPDDPFSEPKRASPYLHSNGNHYPASSSNDSLAAWAKTTRFTVLNHFSHVTNVARTGAHSLLSSPLFQPEGINENGCSPNRGAGGDCVNRNQRTSVASLATSFLQHGPVGPLGPSDPSWKHSELAKKSGTGEYDSARVYLAKWARLVAEEGEVNRLREQESKRLATLEIRRGTVEDTELGAFEIWDLLPSIDKPEPTRFKGSEISQEAWSALFDDVGKPAVPLIHMKQLVFQHGFGRKKPNPVKGTGWEQLGPRAECWSFLLGAQSWKMDKGTVERKKSWDSKAQQYWNIKTSESEDSTSKGEEQEEDIFLKEQKHRILVDCLRVDKKLPLFRESLTSLEDEIEPVNIHVQRLQDVLLGYVIWDRAQEKEASEAGEEDAGQLGGYVQGMSDLCAPLYSLCHGDEAKTFWLFIGLMKRMRRNFYSDQSGMKMQLLSLQKLIAVMDPSLYSHLEKAESLNLFFCFRWLLVCFKREFNYPDILILWEAIWVATTEGNDEAESDSTHSSLPFHGLSNYFQLFVAFGILEHHRDVIIKYLHNFDELLQVSTCRISHLLEF